MIHHRSLFRIGWVAALGGAAVAAELAPTADLGGLPLVTPRTWLMLNFAPDDQSVSAQAPRRREFVIGVAQPVLPEQGVVLQGEAVWSPVRALLRTPPSHPPVRVDELLLGAGPAIERPMGDGRIGWRLSATLGVRILTDMGSATLDRGEHRLFYDESYDDEGDGEDVRRADAVLALRWVARIRLTEADPLRQAPLDLAIDARALRVFPHDGAGSTGRPDWRVATLLVMPTRTTASWLGFIWQQTSQPANALALAAVQEAESGWWFSSGGALRLGAEGRWLIEVGSALDLHSGVAVGTLGFVAATDPPRAIEDGTSSLAAVIVPGRRLASGVATGDEITRRGAAILRSEIRTLIGDQRDVPGATADAVRVDGMLRGQLPWQVLPQVAMGPEAAVGLGLRRDAAAFAVGGYASTQRIEAVGDVGLALRVATGWKGGIAAVEVAGGWAGWLAPGGQTLSHAGVDVELESKGSGAIFRVGLMARF